MSGESKQTTFGGVTVNKYNGQFGGERGCDASVDTDGDGTPVRCSNNASYVILRKLNGMAEFYCRVHAKDTWKEMANDV